MNMHFGCFFRPVLSLICLQRKYMRNKKKYTWALFCFCLLHVLYSLHVTPNDGGKFLFDAAASILHIIFYIILFNLIKNVL